MYSVPMSLADYIPVLLFGTTALILQRDLYNKMSKVAFSLFCTGTIDVFMAGFLKATYKLLYALNICDFKALSQIFFPLQAFGFTLAGIAMICLTFGRHKNAVCAVAAPTVFSGTFVFVALMIFGVVGINVGMSSVAVKMKKPALTIVFMASLLILLCMGYLSAKDFGQSYMNWIAEGVNIAGQLLLFSGVLTLDKAGLKEFKFDSEV